VTPDHTSRELIELLHGDAEVQLPDCPVTAAYRDAEKAARDAYDAWRDAPNVDAYVKYLAAEDRAAAAEEEMTAWITARSAWSGDVHVAA
jgi:hypothetical protein